MLSDEIVAMAEDYIANRSLDCLEKAGSGLFKQTYFLPDCSAVIKVYLYKGDFRRNRSLLFEWAFYTALSRIGLGHLFPETVWGEDEHYGHYMIQEACINLDHLPGDVDKLSVRAACATVRRFGAYDLHSGNAGLTVDGKRPVVMDWGYDSYLPPESLAQKLLDAIDYGYPLPEAEAA